MTTAAPVAPPPSVIDEGIDREAIRRLVLTEYSRQQISAAIHDSILEALHLRYADLSIVERVWLRRWLGAAVPRLTERTVQAIATQLEAAVDSAPVSLMRRLEERRVRRSLGLE